VHEIQIPALPIAHARALALLSVPEPSVSDLEQVIELDPALTAAVIRAANSAASAPVTPIRTARNAIVRIGVLVARRLVIAKALDASFPRLTESGLDVDELWRHLVACALLANSLRSREPTHTDAFTAGLLHDVGRLAMAAQDPRRYAIVVAMARNGADVVIAERQVFGLGHLEWGMAAARTWGFPADMVEAIGHHHSLSAPGLAGLVAQARQTAADLGIGDGVSRPEPPPGNAASAPGEPSSRLDESPVLREVEWYRRALQRAA
jgi:putative nucleotidyltransferase with HDIG domain